MSEQHFPDGFVDKAFAAKRAGYASVCLRCWNGFNETTCPHCDVSAPDVLAVVNVPLRCSRCGKVITDNDASVACPLGRAPMYYHDFTRPADVSAQMETERRKGERRQEYDPRRIGRYDLRSLGRDRRSSASQPVPTEATGRTLAQLMERMIRDHDEEIHGGPLLKDFAYEADAGLMAACVEHWYQSRPPSTEPEAVFENTVRGILTGWINDPGDRDLATRAITIAHECLPEPDAKIEAVVEDLARVLAEWVCSSEGGGPEYYRQHFRAILARHLGHTGVSK